MIYRSLLAIVSSLLFVLLFGPWFIRFLAARRVLERSKKGDSERLDEMHAHKANTPTLGGVMVFAGATLSILAWARLESRLVLLFLGYVLPLLCLGFLDDWKKLRTGRKGISARAKFLAQAALSLLVGAYLYSFPLEVRLPLASGDPAPAGSPGTCLFLPGSADLHLQLGAGFILLVALVTTGASNAVNLTDGLDGLAAGLCTLVGGTLLLVTLLSDLEGSPGSPLVLGGEEVAVCLAALVGGGAGFLWFNRHPARIFMGDTGSLPWGGALGLAAVLLKQELLLLVAGGVLVLEALSVILQVASYKLRRKRVFLCAPLHHHFQFKGWPEGKVTAVFWTAGALLAAFSLAVLTRWRY
jgi:phospho-N-acetylmuramoyl-pentapeptide-transferase